MIYPDYHVLPRTGHSEGLTSVGTDTAKLRWAVPVVYKKAISVVAGLMTAAVLVHGNPMRWLPQAWRLGGPPKQAQIQNPAPLSTSQDFVVGRHNPPAALIGRRRKSSR